MRIGVAAFLTERSITPAELAVRIEGQGFESLFLPEHTHIALGGISKTTRNLHALLDVYGGLYDPFVALSSAASVTTRLKLGTGVCLVAQRDPVILAKEIASLDCLSGGRFVLGVGAGWQTGEMLQHGVAPQNRWSQVREAISALKSIWMEDSASFAGEHYSFDDLWQRPKPHQIPHPPVLIGGNGPRALERVLEFGDGWMPMMRSIEEMAIRIGDLRRRTILCDLSTPEVTCVGVPPVVDVLAQLEGAGCDRALLWLPQCERDEVMAVLDQWVHSLGPMLGDL